MNTASVDLNLPREIQVWQKELKLYETTTKMGIALDQNCFKVLQSTSGSFSFKCKDKAEILPSLASMPVLLPLPAQNKREHIATMLREESCRLFL